MIKKCKICGRTFMQNTRNQMCCSKECAIINNRNGCRERTRLRNEELKENTAYKQGRRREKKEVKSIAEIQKLAREAGMTYGKYVEMQYIKNGGI
jgi:hypothetical protein